MIPNRRAFPRGREDGAYATFPGGASSVRDFSVGGVMLEEEDPLLVGSPINLELHLGEDVFYCDGVVRRTERGSGMAVQFQRLPLLTRERLLRRVERASEANRRRELTKKLDASIREYRVATGASPIRATLGSRPVATGRPPLGDILIRLGIINSEQLAAALTYQRRTGGSLVTALVSSAIVGEEELMRCFEREFRLPVIDLATVHPTREALRLVSHELASAHSILPVGLAGGSLTIAIADPADRDGLQQVKFSSGCNLRLTIAPARSLVLMIDRVYESMKRIAS